MADPALAQPQAIAVEALNRVSQIAFDPLSSIPLRANSRLTRADLDAPFNAAHQPVDTTGLQPFCNVARESVLGSSAIAT
ncbi:MAG TPA: hypothetical protein V6C69_22980 [Trichormus sp.]